MGVASAKIRLFADMALVPGAEAVLPESPSHYLCTVMRLGAGDHLAVFNGRDGEYECTLIKPHKKNAVIRVNRQSRPFSAAPDLWLLFAPLKKDCTDFVLQKAVELGASKIMPVLTANTVAGTVRLDRYQSQVIEAAEQCRRVDLPEVSAPRRLADILSAWEPGRRLFLMDETGQGMPAAAAFEAEAGSPAAILVGPEGGFSPEEIDRLYALPFVRGISLGPRILRAETAAAAALAVWQAVAGDWNPLITKEDRR